MDTGVMEGWVVLEKRTFRIPSLPPSMNAIYQIIFHLKQVQMKPEVRAWKTQAKQMIPAMTPHADSYIFRLDAHFHYNWLHKNSSFRKFDTANMLKVLIYWVAEKVRIKDEYLKSRSWETTPSEDKEFVDCTLTQLAYSKQPNGEQA